MAKLGPSGTEGTRKNAIGILGSSPVGWRSDRKWLKEMDGEFKEVQKRTLLVWKGAREEEGTGNHSISNV
eukprot:1143207-Pelagomonas_calceolata.AAC.2